MPDLVLRLATPADRDALFRLRHAVYANEIGQHTARPDGRLTDPLDDHNVFLAVFDSDRVVGFVSVTPPGPWGYSVDKYVDRADLPLVFDRGLFEIRLLTVDPAYRRGPAAAALMWAAYRWGLAHGASQFVALGRVGATVGMYRKIGLREVGPEVEAGAARYVVMAVSQEASARAAGAWAPAVDRALGAVDWRLDVPVRDAAPCYHGGASFDAVGAEFDDLGRADDVVSADVLDAWFPPAPGVTEAVREHLPFLLRTSPPTDCGGLRRAVADARGVPFASVVPGAGSSDLIFRAFLRWLGPASRVLLLDPTYGEYAHVCEGVVGCVVDRLPLDRDDGYRLDPARLAERLATGDYDLAVVVNPNSPTGAHVPSGALREAVAAAPTSTRVWVDETYAAYVGDTLEPFAAQSENVVVCVSMSKAYALSGARVAYLIAHPRTADALRAVTPPWVVGLPSQVAAVQALADPAYYAARYAETAALRGALAADLAALDGVEAVTEGVANFVLVHLAGGGPRAEAVRQRCLVDGVFLRTLCTMSALPAPRTLRVAVKDAPQNSRVVAAIARALATSPPEE